MNLAELLQMTRQPEARQQDNGFGPLMQFLMAQKPAALDMPVRSSQPVAAPQIQMPGTSVQTPRMPEVSFTPSDNSILQAALSRKTEEDRYEQHLRAKQQLEEEQAAKVKGQGAVLSSDPTTQQMIDSGNTELVALGLKLAQEEGEKKLASQYNENPTFALYDKLMQENTPESLAKAARLMEFKKAGGTNINLGQLDKPLPIADLGMLANPAGEHPLAGTSLSDLKGTDYRVVDSADQEDTKTLATAMSVINEMERQANELYKDPRWNKPKQEGLVNQLVDKAKTTLESNSEVYLQNDPRYKAYEDFVNANAVLIARGLSGEKGPMTEGDIQRAKAKLVTLTGLNPDMPNVGKSKIADLRRSLEARLSVMAQKQVPAAQRQSGIANPLISQAAQRLGVPEDHPVVKLANVINAQESGGNANIHDSVDGAVGGMQVMPNTFKEVMPDGNIEDPLDNATAGLSYLLKHWTDTGGDPMASAMRYHGGPAGDSHPNKKDGLGVSNKRYGEEILARLRRNQPDERAKNDARKAALEERAKKLGIL